MERGARSQGMLPPSSQIPHVAEDSFEIPPSCTDNHGNGKAMLPDGLQGEVLHLSLPLVI